MSLQTEVKSLLEKADGAGEPSMLLETIRLAKQEVSKITVNRRLFVRDLQGDGKRRHTEVSEGSI